MHSNVVFIAVTTTLLVSSMVLLGFAEAAGTCTAAGGTCGSSCSSASFASSECSLSSRCCVNNVPTVTSADVDHTVALSYLYGNHASYTCASRSVSRGCPSLNGVKQDLITPLGKLTKSLSCSVTIAAGTEVGSFTGSTGLCSAFNGRQVAIRTSASCATSLLAMGVYHSKTGCYSGYSGASSDFFICEGETYTYSYSSTTRLYVLLCPQLNSESCGSVWQFGNVLSSPTITFTSLAALKNAETAAAGGRITTRDGSLVCLDPRVGITLQLSDSLYFSVTMLSDGLVQKKSRHNMGRAVRLSGSDARYCTYLAQVYGGLSEYLSATSQYELSWRAPVVAASSGTVATTAAPSTITCGDYGSLEGYASSYSEQTIKCIEQMPLGMIDTTDICAAYTNEDFFRYYFSCMRKDERAWCLIKTFYGSICSYWFSSSNLPSMFGSQTFPGCDNVKYTDMFAATCSAYWGSGGYLMASVQEPKKRRISSATCSAFSSSIGAVASSLTMKCSADNSVVFGYSSSAGDTALIAAEDDITSSANVYETYGEVPVVVKSGIDLPPEPANAKISGAVLLVVGFFATVGAVVLFMLLQSPIQRAWFESHYTQSRRRAIVATVSFFAIVASASLNWAQSPLLRNAYTTFSPAGICRCSSSYHGCPTLSGAFVVNAIFSLIYIVLLPFLCLLTYLHIQILERGGYPTLELINDEALATSSVPVEGRFAVIVAIEKYLLLHRVTRSVVSYLTFISVSISLFLFVGMQNACVADLIVTVGGITFGTPMISSGMILRIVEVVLVLVGTSFEYIPCVGQCIEFAVSQFLTAKRRQFIHLLCLPLAVASTSSGTWSIALFRSVYLSPFTICTCKGWNCATTLGAHHASTALYSVFIAMFFAFVSLRLVQESHLYFHFFSFLSRCPPLEKVWNLTVLGSTTRRTIGKILLCIGVTTLGASLVIFLSVLISSQCMAGALTTSYGLIFAMLAYVGVIVITAAELACSETHEEGYISHCKALGLPLPPNYSTEVEVVAVDAGLPTNTLPSEMGQHNAAAVSPAPTGNWVQPVAYTSPESKYRPPQQNDKEVFEQQLEHEELA